jgi:predicted esterase
MVTILSFTLIGCKAVSSRIEKADTLANQHGFTKELVKTSSFLLTTYSKFQDSKQTLHIYIEGDGYAWVNKSQLSQNPTPTEPMLLTLASLDPHPNVLYIARPCQYTSLALDTRCDAKHWSKARFAEEVIASMNEAISVKNTSHNKLELIGYSGGGAIAVLIAARRNDVKSIRTIAGNLDHIAFNRYHKVSQLENSLNPLTVAHLVAVIPQVHFVGEKDKIVPLFIADNFKNHSTHKNCIEKYQSCVF